MRYRAAILLGLFLSGCVRYTLVTAEPQSICGSYRVHPRIEWSRITQGQLEVWTVDGIGLEALYFTRALEDGQLLFEPPALSDAERPRFRSDMSANDVMDLLVDSLALIGATNLEPEGLRPFSFGGRSGFRFEITFLTQDGLEMQGLAAGTVSDDRLYLIFFRGAHLHYYDRYVQEVERIIDSVDWI